MFLVDDNSCPSCLCLEAELFVAVRGSMLRHCCIFCGDSTLNFILLGWERAFDNIYHSKLLEAMERIGIAQHLIDLAKDVYKHPRFKVKLGSGEA